MAVSNKSSCNKCGTSILETTASKTGGYCTPCKREFDANNEYNKSKETSDRRKEKITAYFEKNNKKARFVVWVMLQLFIIFTLLYGVDEHYYELNEKNDLYWISLSIVVVSGVGSVFFTGVLIYFIYKTFKENKIS